MLELYVPLQWIGQEGRMWVRIVARTWSVKYFFGAMNDLGKTTLPKSFKNPLFGDDGQVINQNMMYSMYVYYNRNNLKALT